MHVLNIIQLSVSIVMTHKQLVSTLARAIKKIRKTKHEISMDKSLTPQPLT